jgi:hypothetical protein
MNRKFAALCAGMLLSNPRGRRSESQPRASFSAISDALPSHFPNKTGLPSVAWLLPVLLLSGCAPGVKPDKLSAPQVVTCLDVKEPMSFTTTHGLFNFPWETRLDRGVYISEKEDAKGTYYRAPPGGITVGRTDRKDRPAGPATYMTYDGGIFIPHDPTVAPTLYKYFSTGPALVQAQPSNVDCSTVVYIRDPSTQKIDIAMLAVGTGIGAATGSAIGHSLHPSVHMSYGQAAGVGLVGGVIGGLIAGAIINSEVGEIQAGPEIDSQMEEKIKVLAAHKVIVRESGHPAAPAVANMAQAPTSPIPAGAPEVSATASVASAVTVPPAPAAAAAGAPTMAVPPPLPASSKVAAPVSVAVPSVSTPSADTAMMPMAQNVANQLGCSSVEANGGSTFVATCGSYSVLIDCDGGQCRPMHTVGAKGNE